MQSHRSLLSPLLSAFAAATLLGSLAAQCPSTGVASFGVGNAHTTFGTAQLSTTSLPTIGTSAGMQIDWANPNFESAAILFGVDPLEPAFPVLGMPFTMLPLIAIPVPFLGTSSSISVPLANDPSICSGLPIYIQAVIGDTAAPGTPSGFVITNRIDWQIGDQPGSVIITEIMQNPAALSDADGEYIELYNPTLNPIDIEGWTLKDDGVDSHVIANAALGVVVPAQGYLVLGRTASVANVGYVYSTFQLGNSVDEVVLLDVLLTEVDRVNYDNGATFPDPNGAAMQLSRNALFLDNNDGSNWCQATLPNAAGGDAGSPGAENETCAVGAGT